MKQRRKQKRGTRSKRPKSRKSRLVEWITVPAFVLALVAFLYLTWFLPRFGREKVLLSDSNTIRCPVGGMPIKSDLFVMTKEGRVYFCCKHCIELFNNDPTKYDEFVDAQQLARRASMTQNGDDRN